MFQTMCALKIYMRRGDNAHGTSVWRKIFRKPLAPHFINRALESGVTHAALSYGNMGFTKGAKAVVSDISEVPFDSLPVCVELVGPKPLLEQFVRTHSKELSGATLVMLEGVHVHQHLTEESESDPGVKVEYLKIGAQHEVEVTAAPSHERSESTISATES